MFESWELSSEPVRVHPWSPERAARLMKGTRATRVWLPGGEIIEMVPGMARQVDRGVGVVLPEHTPLPAVGALIAVELGQAQGVHRFESTVARIAALPADVQIPRRGTMLVLHAPGELRYYTRRETIRVAVRLQVSAWKLRADPERQTWMPDGNRILGELLDLSSGGCAFQTDGALPIGTRLFLELRIDDNWIPLEAEVVRTSPGWPMRNTVLGIRFLNVPDRLSQLLSQTVMARQRSG